MDKLAENELHLWRAHPDSIRDPALLSAYHTVLNQEERTRLARFVREEDRHLFLVSHALVRATLSHYSTVLPGNLEFFVNEFGRPEIIPEQNEHGLRFNLSHTEGMVALGVTVGHDIGVDVQIIEENIEPLEIADRYFSPLEAKALHNTSYQERSALFCEFWVLKEAYIKAHGKGLSLDLKEFTVHLEDKTSPWISHHQSPGALSTGNLKNSDTSLENPLMHNKDCSALLWLFAPSSRHHIGVVVLNSDNRPMRVQTREGVPLLP